MEIVLALCAACALASTPVLQQAVAVRAPERIAMWPRLMVWLARHPKWLLGVVTLLAGSTLEALSLYFGAITVAEPLLATNVVFAVVLTAIRDRTWPLPREWAGAAAVCGGIALLLVALEPQPARTDATSRGWIVAGLVTAGFVGACWAFARISGAATRCTLLGAATGAALGIQHGMNRAASHLILAEGWRGLLEWQPWGVLGIGAYAYVTQNIAHRAGSVPGSQPALLTSQVVFAMSFGVLALGEGVRTGPGPLSLAAAAIVMAVGGIVLLSRAPLARRETALAAHPGVRVPTH